MARNKKAIETVKATTPNGSNGVQMRLNPFFLTSDCNHKEKSILLQSTNYGNEEPMRSIAEPMQYALTPDQIRDFCADAIASGKLPSDLQIESCVGSYSIRGGF